MPAGAAPAARAVVASARVSARQPVPKPSFGPSLDENGNRVDCVVIAYGDNREYHNLQHGPPNDKKGYWKVMLQDGTKYYTSEEAFKIHRPEMQVCTAPYAG